MRVLDPNRQKYRHAFRKREKCVFCAAKETLECPSLKSEHWRVLVNRYPYMDGNLMIVPVRHAIDTSELTAPEWEDFGRVLEKVKKTLGKIFKTGSFNIGLHIGPESGASIPHLHWQVLPRKIKNITMHNTFFDLYVVAIPPEETKRLVEKAGRKKKRPK